MLPVVCVCVCVFFFGLWLLLGVACDLLLLVFMACLLVACCWLVPFYCLLVGDRFLFVVLLLVAGCCLLVVFCRLRLAAGWCCLLVAVCWCWLFFECGGAGGGCGRGGDLVGAALSWSVIVSDSCLCLRRLGLTPTVHFCGPCSQRAWLGTPQRLVALFGTYQCTNAATCTAMLCCTQLRESKHLHQVRELWVTAASG